MVLQQFWSAIRYKFMNHQDYYFQRTRIKFSDLSWYIAVQSLCMYCVIGRLETAVEQQLRAEIARSLFADESGAE